MCGSGVHGSTGGYGGSGGHDGGADSGEYNLQFIASTAEAIWSTARYSVRIGATEGETDLHDLRYRYKRLTRIRRGTIPWRSVFAASALQ